MEKRKRRMGKEGKEGEERMGARERWVVWRGRWRSLCGDVW